MIPGAGVLPLACCAACPGFLARGRVRGGRGGRRGTDRFGAGQAAAAGGPLAASQRVSRSCSRCQAWGRCRVMWPLPWRAVRAATAIRSRRMVAALALAKGRLASAPAARSRLCAIAAMDSHAAFAAKTPDGM